MLVAGRGTAAWEVVRLDAAPSDSRCRGLLDCRWRPFMPSPPEQTSTAAPDLDPNSGLRASQPAGFRIGAVFGVPVYIHGTWLIIFMLITYSLATQFTQQHQSWSPQQHWALGIITSILFFASVVFHELSH